VITATKEIVDRSPGHLADDVPAGLFDGGDRVTVNLPTVGVEVASHPLVNGLDLERVHPFEARSQLVDCRLHCAREGVQCALADAIEAGLISIKTDKEPVFPGISDDISCRPGDLHVRS
jgi:hypothetical protein